MNRLNNFWIYILLVLASTYACTNNSGNRNKNNTSASSERIEELLKEMTIEEKIGQLSLFTSDWDVTGPTLRSDYQQLIKEGKVGSIFNAFTVDYIRDLQALAVEESRLKIPLLFGYDVIHGHRTIFPIPLAQSCSWDMTSIEQSERIAALEASAEGINWTFAPMVDVARDPRWGRVSEGSGEDTWLGSQIAKARVNGFQGNNLEDNNTILACAKHFAAYGAPQSGRDYHTVDMSMLSLYEYYLPPYKACIDAGAASVMTSFNEINGVPATSNKWLMTELLREDWGFEGFIVTDYTSIYELIPHGVAADSNDAARLAMHAGVDMDMQGSVYLNYLKGLIDNNEISIEQIDAAVRYILQAKEKLGLFDDPYRYCNEDREKTEIMTEKNLSAARELVAKSCVLLKNENQTLPIPAKVKSIAVIGPLADSKRDMLGNWSAAGEWEKCVTLLEGIKNKVGDNVHVTYTKGCSTTDEDRKGFEEASLLAKNADYVILALGENGWMSGEAACRTDIDLPGIQNELAKLIIDIGKPTAVVLFNGRPLAISSLDQMAPAILETWFGGTQAGNGIADVLFGDYNPSGKLTMTFPQNVGQVPLFYNAKNTGRPYNPDIPDYKYVSRYLFTSNQPLYPFGFGLSYTTFSYSDLHVNVTDNNIEISVLVSNTGTKDGEEVAQLYVQDKVGSITRPVKELKGFQKVMIKAGEAKKMNFTLSTDDLAFYHPDLSKYYEPGEFEVFVGTNSKENISKTVTVE